MSELKLRQLIAEYLQQVRLMQLATVSGGSPWACSVWFGFDDDLNIYFFSAINRRHSLEIEKDNRVAGAIALPQIPQDQPRGLQFEERAQKLTGETDIARARSTYEGRIFDAGAIDSFMDHKDRPHAFYKITPTRFCSLTWLIFQITQDKSLFHKNMPQELKIRLKEPEGVEARLRDLGAVSKGRASFTDTYFNQPPGEVLKITEDEEGGSLMALRAQDGKFQITKKEAVQDVEAVKNELFPKYGIKRVLKGRRRYFSLGELKLTFNIIEGVGDFLILTGENPIKEFVEDKLGIKDPEYITVSFDNL